RRTFETARCADRYASEAEARADERPDGRLRREEVVVSVHHRCQRIDLAARSAALRVDRMGKREGRRIETHASRGRASRRLAHTLQCARPEAALHFSAEVRSETTTDPHPARLVLRRLPDPFSVLTVRLHAFRCALDGIGAVITNVESAVPVFRV